MLSDARELPAGTRLTSTVCVIGAGAAGITLALRLGELGVNVLLLESGGFEPDEQTQQLYRGEVSNYHALDVTRLRYVGGTTNHFAGQSRPLEPIDFETMSWHQAGGWPISRDDALAHLARAVDVLGLAADEWETVPHFGERTDEDLAPGDDLDLVVFQAAGIRMGSAYRSDLERSRRVELVIHANARKLRLSEDRGSVDRVELRTLGGTDLLAQARVYVVATGGIDAARLLLDSDDEVPAGIGNGNDLVGRYFSDHPTLAFVPVAPRDPLAPAPQPRSRVEPSWVEDLVIAIVELLTPTDAAQRRLELPGFSATLFLDPQPWSEPSVPHDSASASAVADLVAMPGAGGAEQVAPLRHSLAISWEQVPNRESRVTLLDERNEVGERLVRVDWRLGDQDEDTVRRALALIGRHLVAEGLGAVLAEPTSGRWLDAVEGGHHHMGTLRMADAPSAGVVNRDLRVHDVANLYIASSAVFPTYGYVNPTLNLVALTLRLAERLRAEVG